MSTSTSNGAAAKVPKLNVLCCASVHVSFDDTRIQSPLGEDSSLRRFAIKAEFRVSIFFGRFGLENAYIKRSKLGLGFTLEFARIHLLCFTLFPKISLFIQITRQCHYYCNLRSDAVVVLVGSYRISEPGVALNSPYISTFESPPATSF